MQHALTERLTNEGNTSAAMAMMNTLAKTVDCHNKHLYRQGELLAKATLAQIVQAIVGLIQQNFSTVPGYEDRLKQVTKGIEPLLLEAQELDPNIEAISNPDDIQDAISDDTSDDTDE